jgi:dihydroxyacetone kinase-like protein
MKRTTIGMMELGEILRFASEAITREESRLNALDAAIGDGDHGITVRTGFQAVRKAVDNTPNDADISTLLGNAGRAFMNATGGAIGIILGRMLLCGQQVFKGHETLGVGELKNWLEAMESTITAAGKAKPGDKTILDAVHGADVAVTAYLAQGNDINEALRAASQGAEQAANDTANMLCKVGRASRLGEQVLGHRDPGAVTFSIIMHSFYRWLVEHPAESSGVQALHSQA